MKKLIIVFTLLLSFGAMRAEDVVQVIPFAAPVGVTENDFDEDHAFYLAMTNTNSYTAMQLELYLPEGLEIQTGDMVWDFNPDRFEGVTRRGVFTPYHTMNVDKMNDVPGHYHITMYDAAEYTSIKGEEGWLVAFYYLTKSDMQPGYYPIVVSGTVLAIDSHNDVKPETSISYVKIGDPAPNEVFDLGEGYVPSFVESEMGNTANVVANGKCANLTLTDGYAFATSKAFTASNASYERTVTNSWGTIILPYAVESNADVTYYQLADVDLTNGILSFEQVANVAANVPAVFKTNGTKLEVKATNINVPICSGDAEGTTVSGLTLVGSLSGKTYQNLDPNAADGVYFIRDNKFWRGKDDVIVTPFRACFESTSVPAMSFAISDLTETGVREVKAVEATTEIYDLNGICVGTDAKTLPAGFYIVNGKKVIIKK